MGHDELTASTLVGSGAAARALNVSAETVRRWVAQGRLPAIRTAEGFRLFRIVDISCLLAAQADSEQPANRPEAGE